jgi:hypothetical protein
MAFIGDELPLAIEHAGFAPDRVKVWTCTGGERDGCRAIWFKPTMKIDDDRFLSDEQKQEAELPEHRDKHRIAIFHDAPIAADLASALMGALLRHELEHARQFDVAGVTTLDIHDNLLQPAIQRMAGGLPGSAVFYNFTPLEMDANAAAAQYQRDHHRDAVDAILVSDQSQLARALMPPNDPSTLLTRTVACLYLFRDVCEAMTGRVPFDKRLDAYDKRAGQIWRELDDVAA